MAAMIVVSCYKSDLSNTTHPEDGMVTVNMIFPTDVEISADSYTIIFNGENYTTTTITTPLDAIVEPGEYYVYVYSNTSSISVEDNTATNGTIIATAESEGENVKSFSDHAYFGMQKVIVTADAVITSNVSMAQISRDINFNLQITEGDPDRIVSLTSSLSGVSEQWECVGDTIWGTATSIDTSLEQGASIVRSEVDNRYIAGSIRVLGINGEKQTLEIHLTYDDGKTQTITSDLSTELSGANSNKSTPITLSGDLSTPTEGSMEDATIDNWTQMDGDSQTVN